MFTRIPDGGLIENRICPQTIHAPFQHFWETGIESYRKNQEMSLGGQLLAL